MTQNATSPPASTTSFVKSTLTNGAATCTATLFTNPLELTKTRFQLQGELGSTKRAYSSVLQAARHVVHTEGFAGLQKGLTAAWAYQLIGNGVRLATYDKIKDSFGGPLTLPETLASAAAAGCCGTVLAQPFYLVKVRLQAYAPATPIGYRQHEYRGLVDGLYKIWSQEGGRDVRALWQGLSGTLGRSVVASSVQLTSYDFCKNILINTVGICQPPDPQHPDKLSLLWLTLCASMLTGIITTTAMEPFDVAATRLCNQDTKNTSVATTRPYSGLFEALLKTARVEGIHGLYKGWMSSYLRIGPHTTLMFVFVEQFKQMFKG